MEHLKNAQREDVCKIYTGDTVSKRHDAFEMDSPNDRPWIWESTIRSVFYSGHGVLDTILSTWPASYRTALDGGLSLMLQDEHRG